MSAKQAVRSCGLFLPSEPLQLLQTKPYDYSLLSKQDDSSSSLAAMAHPDCLHELTFRRAAISTWLQSLSSSGYIDGTPVPDVVLEGMSGLAARLDGLIRAIAAAAGGPAGATAAQPLATAAGAPAAATMIRVNAEWTSALSKKPRTFLQLDCLPQELAMMYTAYATVLRHSALQRCSQNLETAPTSLEPPAEVATADSPQVPAVLTAAVAELRRAAGVYGYLAGELLPALAGVGAVRSGDRPLELLPAAARFMQQLCLAEAQSLVAVAAEVKGMSPGAQKALHADRLLDRLLPAAVALHGAWAQMWLARERYGALEMGEAEAACEECLRLLDSAGRCMDFVPGWMERIQENQATCSALRSTVHRERLSITFQPLPKQPPDALANPAVRVAPDTFKPEPVMPPVPPVNTQAAKGSFCSIM